MRAPAFWGGPPESLPARLLSPIGVALGAATARRAARPGFRASIPVLCCGNVTLGGAGKTLVVLDLAQLLSAVGLSVHVLLRGYGGTARGPHRVATSEDSSLVGDEALLAAEVAPTWIGADRAASARAAIAAGANVLLLDDGLQNPTLAKDLSLLVIDGAFGFGNGRLFPAGPLRETIAAGAARCRAAVLIGADRAGAAALLPSGLAILRARIVPDPAITALARRKVVAFAGIGRPEKVFATLREAGALVVEAAAFGDHHRYRAREIDRLHALASRHRAVLVTTAKDWARLTPGLRADIVVARVGLAWDDPAALTAILSPLSTPLTEDRATRQRTDNGGWDG